jgi:hypothetical protein
VTFVSSPRFFFDCVKDFKHAEIILGIADGDVKRGFAEGLGIFYSVKASISLIVFRMRENSGFQMAILRFCMRVLDMFTTQRFTYCQEKMEQGWSRVL